MDDPIHELLLRLAGRVDDDLLADARELVAVGEDGHALELVTAALAADATPLPPPVRAELVNAAAAARIDLDADAALAPAAPDTTAHRFSATADVDVPVVAAARELPERLRQGVRLRLAWRQTPAGPAPTPLPQPVLLVETAADGRPGEVLAYQVGAAMARSGVHVAVEVLTSGRPLTSYHAAALRDSTPLSGDAPPRAASPAAKVESVVAEVVEQVTASHRPAPPPEEAADERPVDLFAVEEPAPRPVPMRAWQGARRRRGFGEQVAEVSEVDEVEVADDHEPLPSPVPLARRTRPRPVGEAAEQPDPLSDPIPDEGSWTDEWASGDWALAEGGSPDEPDSAEQHDGSPHGATAGAAGATARPENHAHGGPAEPHNAGPHSAAPGPHPTNAAGPHDANAATGPRPVGPFGGAPGAPTGPSAPRPTAAPAPPQAAPAAETTPVGSHALFTDPTAQPVAPDTVRPAGGPAHALAEPPTGPLPVVGPPMAEALLKPEALARLSDADRELLTRLQSELANGNGPNGAAPA